MNLTDVRSASIDDLLNTAKSKGVPQDGLRTIRSVFWREFLDYTNTHTIPDDRLFGYARYIADRNKAAYSAGEELMNSILYPSREVSRR